MVCLVRRLPPSPSATACPCSGRPPPPHSPAHGCVSPCPVRFLPSHPSPRTFPILNPSPHRPPSLAELRPARGAPATRRSRGRNSDLSSRLLGQPLQQPTHGDGPSHVSKCRRPLSQSVPWVAGAASVERELTQTRLDGEISKWFVLDLSKHMWVFIDC